MPTELEVQRRLTTAFILTQPVTITLKPRVKTQRPAGGFGWQEAVPRAPQVMRLVEPRTSVVVVPAPIVTSDGIQREVVFQLLGEWDATIGLYDVFAHDEHEWEIVQLAHFNGWEQRASVARYG